MPISMNVARALAYAKTSTAPFIIRDTNNNIAANADALVALGPQIVSLQGDNGTFFPQLNVADLLELAAKTYYNGSLETFISINDTAAHVAASAATLGGLAVGLARVGNGLTVTISDSAAHIAANANALKLLAAGRAQTTYYSGYFNSNSLIVTISDTAAEVAANVLALRSLAAGLALDKYLSGQLNNNSLTVNISDTAANFATHSAVLQTLAAGLAHDTYNNGYSNNNHLTFTITDTAAHVAASAGGLQKLAAGLAKSTYFSGASNNMNFIFTVSDSAAHVAANVTALNALAAQLAQDTYGATYVRNNNQLTFSISDTAAHVVATAAALQKLAVGLAQDTFYGSFSGDGRGSVNNLTIVVRDTAAHVSAYAVALNSLAVGLAHDTFNQGNANINSLRVTINDTAVYVAANIVALQALAAGLARDTYGFAPIQNNNYLTITISDTANHVVTNAVALHTLATKLAGDTYDAGYTNDTLTITLKDTFSNIILDAYNINTLPVPIAGIKLTDSGMPAKTLTASQYAADATVLAEIITPCHLTISGEVAGNVAVDIKNRHVTAIGVVDTAANVLAVLDSALAPNSTKLSAIALTDTGIPTLAITATQFAHDAAVLGKISKHYSLAISGETAVNVATDVKNSHVTAIAVLDSAANVSANLSSLASNVHKLSGITLTDQVIPTLSLTAAQVSNDLAALNAITSPYYLSVKDTLNNIGSLVLDGVHNQLIEIMPTSLQGMLFETSQVNDLNLSLIKLSGDRIIEKAYHGTGTELDIMTGNMSGNALPVGQLFFTHNSESQLQLLGLGKTVVHAI